MKKHYLLIMLVMAMLMLLIAILSHDFPTVNLNLTTPQEIENRSVAANSGGYLLANGFWEQFTAASRNMLTLQCWARKHNMSVVAPFVRKSYIVYPTRAEEVKSLLKFSDVYDLGYWNGLSQNAGYFPLVQWEEFLQRAPRKLITVNFEYSSTKKNAGNNRSVHKEKQKQVCTRSSSWNQFITFLESKKFTVVRKRCINFSQNDEFSEPEFYKEVFGKYQPHESTVLFGVWRGLLNNRMHVNGSKCDTPTVNMYALPSKRVLLDVKKYKEKYLKTSNYVAIFLRMEKALETKQSTMNCFHETLDHWRKMVSDTGVNTTFLSTDIGRLGSDSFKAAKHSLGGELELFDTIYRKTLTIREWEATFKNVASSLQLGYIAMLQKAIASQAKCVLFVGGGSFQVNALQIYRNEHAEKDWCVYLVKKCSTYTTIKEQFPKWSVSNRSDM